MRLFVTCLAALLLLILVGVPAWMLSRLTDVRISAAFQDGFSRLGYEVRFADLDWSYYPVGIELRTVTLGLAGNNLLTAEKIWFALDAGQLLSINPKVAVRDLSFTNARIVASVDSQGRIDWLPERADAETADEPASFFLSWPLQSIDLSGTRLELEFLDRNAAGAQKYGLTLQAERLLVRDPWAPEAPLQFKGQMVAPRDAALDLVLDAYLRRGAGDRGLRFTEIIGTFGVGREPALSGDLALRIEDAEDAAGNFVRLGLEIKGPLGVQLQAECRGLGESPIVSGSISLLVPEVLPIATALETEFHEALVSLSGSGGFSLSADRLQFDELRLAFNAQEARGSGYVRFQPQPAFKVTLTADHLDDMAVWFPRIRETPLADTRFTGRLLATESLRDLRWEIDVRVQAMSWRDESLKRLSFTGRSDGRYIRATAAAQNFWGGEVNLQASVELAADRLRWRLEPTLSGIDAATLVSWLNLPVRLHGPVNLRGTVQASGNSVSALSQTMQGSLQLRGVGGGIDTGRLKPMLRAIGVLADYQSLGARWPQRQGYIQLQGTLGMSGGITDHSLKIAFDNIEFEAKGSIDPWTLEMNYDAGFAVRNGLSRYFQPEAYPDALLDLTWPVRCQGSYQEELPCSLQRDATADLLRTRGIPDPSTENSGLDATPDDDLLPFPRSPGAVPGSREATEPVPRTIP